MWVEPSLVHATLCLQKNLWVLAHKGTWISATTQLSAVSYFVHLRHYGQTVQSAVVYWITIMEMAYLQPAQSLVHTMKGWNVAEMLSLDCFEPLIGEFTAAEKSGFALTVSQGDKEGQSFLESHFQRCFCSSFSPVKHIQGFLITAHSSFCQL